MIKVFSLAILLIFSLYFNLGCTTADLDIAEAPLETFLGHWDIEGGGVLFSMKKIFLFQQAVIRFLERILLRRIP